MMSTEITPEITPPLPITVSTVVPVGTPEKDETKITGLTDAFEQGFTAGLQAGRSHAGRAARGLERERANVNAARRARESSQGSRAGAVAR